MAHHYTPKENKIFMASLPKKSVGVKVVIKSDKGNILLVKPNYKDNWQFPGGGVDAHEDPKDGAIREIQEETGLIIKGIDLELKDTLFRRDYDNLILIYEYLLPISENEKIAIPEDELEGYQFYEPYNIKLLLGRYYGDFIDKFLLNN